MEEEYCPVRSNRAGEYDSHCDCWWDGFPCCACGAPEDPKTCKVCGASECKEHV